MVHHATSARNEVGQFVILFSSFAPLCESFALFAV